MGITGQACQFAGSRYSPAGSGVTVGVEVGEGVSGALVGETSMGAGIGVSVGEGSDVCCWNAVLVAAAMVAGGEACWHP